MKKYPNTPTNGLIFSHFLQLSSCELNGWEKTTSHLIKDISQKTVLDIGCGFGSSFIYFLKTKGYNPKQFIHLDANPEVFLREKSSIGYMFWPSLLKELFYDGNKDIKIVADATKLPLENRCIDIVHQDMVLADNDDLDSNKVIEEVKRVLKIGGLYISDETRYLGDKRCVGYDGTFELVDLEFPPRPIYRKIKD